jgi:putative transposase
VPGVKPPPSGGIASAGGFGYTAFFGGQLMSEYQRGPHTVHDIKYHFVWVTKYRYPVLTGEVALSAREHIRRICMEQEITILKGAVGHDHIHLLVSAPPNVSPADIMRFIKGKSSRILFAEHPFLKKRYWGQHLWARGYFCASSGTVTDDVIRQYIEHQKLPCDDGFNVADDAQRL